MYYAQLTLGALAQVRAKGREFHIILLARAPQKQQNRGKVQLPDKELLQNN